MTNRRRRTAFVPFVIALVLLVLAPTAGAAENGDWFVDPGGGDGSTTRSHFVYTLKPDQVFRDTVVVGNVSDVPITLDLYATDAFNTELDGGFALLAPGETPTDVGSWIELGTDQVTLEPGTQAEIPFLVSVPLDATPGDHAGAIVAQSATTEERAEVDGDVGIDIQRRVGARMYVRVAGPLQPALQVTQVAVDSSSALLPPLSGAGDAVIGYEIKNTGNTRLTPTARLEIEGILGGSVFAFPERELRELLPGSSIVVTEAFEGLPPLNRLSAKVTVTGSTAGDQPVTATGSTTFWAVSWISFACFLLIPVLFVLWRRARRGPRDAPDDEPPPPKARAEKELVGV